LLGKCRKFLAQDLTANVLVLGDCYSPLLEASTLYCACKGNQVVGACSVFRGFSKPSVALGTATAETKRILLENALRDVKSEFISICPTAEITLLKEYASVLQLHYEQQMVTDSPNKMKSNNKATKVRKYELQELDKFYLEHRSEAWIPLQFKVGPFYCIKQDGRLVSIAGVHLCTPQIAHLGSIVTDEAYRNRGFGTACTSALANQLSATGRILSLFVRTDNEPAIRIYESLGFVKKREVVFVTIRKKAVN